MDMAASSTLRSSGAPYSTAAAAEADFQQLGEFMQEAGHHTTGSGGSTPAAGAGGGTGGLVPSGSAVRIMTQAHVEVRWGWGFPYAAGRWCMAEVGS